MPWPVGCLRCLRCRVSACSSHTMASPSWRLPLEKWIFSMPSLGDFVCGFVLKSVLFNAGRKAIGTAQRVWPSATLRAGTRNVIQEEHRDLVESRFIQAQIEIYPRNIWNVTFMVLAIACHYPKCHWVSCWFRVSFKPRSPSLSEINERQCYSPFFTSYLSSRCPEISPKNCGWKVHDQLWWGRKRLKVTETLPGCRLQQDAQHLAQIENQVSQQQSARSAAISVWIQIPMTTLAATGKQIKALLWKNSREELGGLVANGVAICCHMLLKITKVTEPVWCRHWHLYIYICFIYYMSFFLNIYIILCIISTTIQENHFFPDRKSFSNLTLEDFVDMFSECRSMCKHTSLGSLDTLGCPFQIFPALNQAMPGLRYCCTFMVTWMWLWGAMVAIAIACSGCTAALATPSYPIPVDGWGANVSLEMA